MNTNYTNSGNTKIILPDLSYEITGIMFKVHNELGRFAREKQYCDLLEKLFVENHIVFQREFNLKGLGNIIDFLIEDKIVLEIKAKRLILKDDFYQTQRYLQALNKPLGIIVNFRNRYLKPIRVVRIETDVRKKFL